ncbi:MAG TPA: DUF2339 domain-containing protein [Blastocatellia bacterium]|jgi:hypothetical protein
MANAETKLDEEQVHRSIRELAARLSRLEAHLGLSPFQESRSSMQANSMIAAPQAARSLKDESEGIELRVGEFGLAWVGSAVLFLGIVFLMAYISSLGYRALATALGYAAAIGLYSTASLWRQNIPHLSRVLAGTSLLLLYYTTMRLGFFSATPLIPDQYIVFLLLLIVVALQLAYAVRRNWQALAGMAILLLIASALFIDTTHVSLSVVAGASVVAAYLAVSRVWRLLIPFAIFLAYAAHLLWLMGNPIMGHPLQAVSEHQYNLAYLFLYATIFYLPILLEKGRSADEPYAVIMVLLNTLGFSLLVALVTLTHFQERYGAVYVGVAGFFLALAIIQWLKTRRQYAPAIYASFGYMALSIAIYGYAKMPAAFFWLSLQSLLVVSMALWFRSRTLVVINSIIYINVLLAYFAASPSSNRVNLSFALVALASARVMNWQKQRLTLRTDLLRNIYLVIAFVLIFYTLYRAVPANYVTLSWTATAVIYFLLSYLLNNIKYRLMGISAILLTVVYLIFVDLAHLDPVFRVAAFMFLGLLALIISHFYTRARYLTGKENR